MSDNTFQRYEKKYLMDEIRYYQLLRSLEGYVQPDRYPSGTVSNIYFDTPDYRLIRTSLEKPLYKEKLRLRSYGRPTKEDRVYLELKKKYDGVVYKRRIPMSLEGAEAYLSGKAPVGEAQIAKEIDWVRRYYTHLKPAMFIACERKAFCAIDDKRLRLTFDHNLVWRKESLRLDVGNWGTPILEMGQWLLEIKCEGAMPLWLSHILDLLAIYPVSFSKYGRAYLASCEGEYHDCEEVLSYAR